MSFHEAIEIVMNGFRNPETVLEQDGGVVRYADLSASFYAKRENDASLQEEMIMIDF